MFDTCPILEPSVPVSMTWAPQLDKSCFLGVDKWASCNYNLHVLICKDCGFCYLGNTINNEEEIQALYQGILILQEIQAQEVIVFGNFAIINNQIRKEGQSLVSPIAKTIARVKGHFALFNQNYFYHTLWNCNGQADSIANWVAVLAKDVLIRGEEHPIMFYIPWIFNEGV